MVKIREAVEKDTSVILKCIRGLAEYVNQLEMVTATEEGIREALFKPDSHVKAFVAINSEESVCAFALIFKTFSTFKATSNYYIEDLFVFPEYRNFGIGKSLLNFIAEFARKNGANKVEWYVNKKNREAIDFYKRIGAKELDYKMIYYLEI